MSRPKVLIDSATVTEAEACLASIRDAKLVLQLKAIIAVRDYPVDQVAQIFRVSRRSIFRWVHRLKEGGADALRDHPKGHRKSKLDDEQKAAVEHWVVTGQTAQGEQILWTVEKLRLAIAREFGVLLGKTPLWRHLKIMNLAPRRPRPQHAKADPAAQAAFKKTLRKTRQF